MDFLGAVNRVLVNNTIIKGDDDLITSFSDSQHEATIRFARNAITSELNHLASFFTFPQEKASGQITTTAGTRVYPLPADFVQFYGSRPYLYLSTDASQRCYEYNGGIEQVRQEFTRYLTDQGYENWWYWEDAASKSIALLQVPDTTGRIWNFEYEKSVAVSNSTDPIPFQTEPESEAFADMAGRRYKYMTDKELDMAKLQDDSEYMLHQGTLFNLIRNKKPNPRYGRRYA